MSVRQDQVQIRIDFITDESRMFAKTILQTEEYNKLVAESKAKIAQYQKQLKEATGDEQKRIGILQKIALEENKVAENLTRIAVESRKVAEIDLTKLTPAQLTDRAKQLALAMRDIPRSAPYFSELEGELSRVNAQVAEMRARAKGIQDDGKAGGGQGGLIGSIVGRVAGFAAVIGAIIATLQGFFNFAKAALADFDAGAKADAALADRIRSTQGAAGRSVEQLKDQAAELQKITLFPDDVTKKGQELLLTFTNIRGEIFDRTIPLAQDLSQVFQQDLAASSVQLGKALNDPVRGITALQRVGITFSAEQKKMIAALVETGDVAGAQTVILDELEKQVGGAARAAAEAGQGPYQLLRQRYEEIRESIGALISQGLTRLRPILENVVTFFEGLTEALLSGEAATGQFSGAINATVTVLKIIGGVLNLVYQALKLQFEIFSAVATKIAEFVQEGLKIPIVGEAIRAILAPIKLLIDAITNLPATWAGVVAAVKQGAELMSQAFQAIVLRAQVFAKEIDLALTIKQDTKARLARELNDLRLRQEAIKAGKSIGEAYTEARNKALAESAPGAAAATTGGKVPPGGFTVGGVDAATAEKRRNDIVEAELKAVEAGNLRREVLLENARLKDEIDEREYQNRLIALKKQKLQEQLDLFRRFKQEETAEALKVQNELLRLEADTRRTPLTPVAAIAGARAPGQVASQTPDARGEEVADAGKEILLAQLRDKFAAAVLTEQEYELAKLQLKEQFLVQELEMLRAATVPQVEEIRKREAEKAKVEEEIANKRLENAQRTAELKRQTEEAALGASIDAIGAGIELLAADEAARKKNATAIKAFQTGQIIASGVAEVQKIWEKAASFGPLQSIVAAIQTAAAVLRTTGAVRKIAATKFERGTLMNFTMAKMGFFGGRPHSRGGTKGYFDDGTAIEVEKDEAFAVVNKRNAPILRLLSRINALGGNGVPFFARGGLRTFAGGGLPAINTTPVANFALPAAAAPAIGNLDVFVQAVGLFEQIVAAFPREVAANLSYLDVEKKAAEIARVRDDASL